MESLGQRVESLTDGAVELAASSAEKGQEEEILQQAIAFHSAGQLQKAEPLYRQVLARNPAHSRALSCLAVLAEQLGRLDIAVALLEQAISIDPQIADYHYNLANAYAKEGKAGQAISSYQEALRLNPRHVGAHNNLGTLLIKQENLEAASRHLQAALQLRPDWWQARNNLGTVHLASFRHAEAARCFEEAIRCGGTHPDLYRNLGDALAGQLKFDEALAAYEQALKLSPGDAAAVGGVAKILEQRGEIGKAYELVRPLVERGENHFSILKTYTSWASAAGQEEAAIQLIEKVIRTSRAHSSIERRSMFFWLGRLYDGIGQYEKAFAAYRQGNQMRGLSLDKPRFTAAVNEIIESFSPAAIAAMPRASEECRLPVFIVGMPRSGTSLVEQILASHPQVHGAGELVFMSKIAKAIVPAGALSHGAGIAKLSDLDVRRLASDYLQQLQALAPEAECLTDKMPYNFQYLGLISLLFPGAPIIHCVRDRIDTCLSCYFQDFVGEHRYAYDLGDLGYYYNEYERLMRHWHALGIPILDVSYEDLVADQERVSRDIVAHCGLPWEDGCLEFHRSKREVHTASYQQVRKPIYSTSVKRWRNYAAYLEPLLIALNSKEDGGEPKRTGERVMGQKKGKTKKKRPAKLKGRPRPVNSPPGVSVLAMQLQEAVQHHRAGRHQEAELLYRQILAIDPTHGDALCNFGVLAEEVGRPDVGAQLLAKAIESSPANPVYHFNLGNMLAKLDKIDEAIGCYRETLRLQPDHADAHNNLALIFKDRGQTDIAMQHLQHVLRLRPEWQDAHNNLGTLYKDYGMFDEALEHYQRAVELGMSGHEPYVNMGNSCLAIGRLEEALEAYENALDRAPDEPRALGGIGAVYEKQGDLDHAFEILKPLIDAGEQDIHALGSYANILHQRGARREAIDLLEGVLAGPITRQADRRAFCFQLGKIYDADRNYDAAFRWYHQGNATKNLRLDRLGHASRITEVTNLYTAETFEGMPESGNPEEMPIFILGMPRSGTSLTEQILASHSQVYGAGELKTMRGLISKISALAGGTSFPAGIDRLSAAQLNGFAAEYLQALRALASGEPRVTDKMPYNFQFIGLIRKMFPEARIIHCRREPYDTCLSIYFQDFVGRHEYAYDLGDLAFYYREYDRLMAHWRDTLRIPMFEVFYEEMVADQEGVTRRLLDFCSLGWEDRCLQFHKTQRLVNTASYQQVRQPIYVKSRNRWKNYEEHIGELLPGLADLHETYQGVLRDRGQ